MFFAKPGASAGALAALVAAAGMTASPADLIALRSRACACVCVRAMFQGVLRVCFRGGGRGGSWRVC